MKKIFLFTLLFISITTIAQHNNHPYHKGEFMNYNISYGFIDAGYAIMELREAKMNNLDCFHVICKGGTKGVTNIFYKVKDDYQSYFNKQTGEPVVFIRKIQEGGYSKNVQINFDTKMNTALVNDLKNKKIKSLTTEEGVQDMLSVLYHLRRIETSKLKKNDVLEVYMFFDEENYLFKLKLLGREKIKTDVGKVSCLKFRPYVQSGRVFKESESITLWVSDDLNKIPVLMKADLIVGSIKVTLDEYRNLKYPLGTEIVYQD